MTVKTFTTTWPQSDHTMLIAENESGDIIGTVMLDFYGRGKKECLLWNLQVKPEYRKIGVATALLDNALQAAAERVDAATLEWSLKESPRWVFQWYERRGFEEHEFGRDCAKMIRRFGKR